MRKSASPSPRARTPPSQYPAACGFLDLSSNNRPPPQAAIMTSSSHCQSYNKHTPRDPVIRRNQSAHPFRPPAAFFAYLIGKQKSPGKSGDLRSPRPSNWRGRLAFSHNRSRVTLPGSTSRDSNDLRPSPTRGTPTPTATASTTASRTAT
jgi:hypothetical protein